MPKKKPILFEGLDKITIKSIDKLLWGEVRGEKRVRLPSETKKKVYERAKKRCQSCGKPLKRNQGEFHHLRKPTVKSSPSTIQFLCPSCHKEYGHEWKTRTVRSIFETKKVPYIVRKKVRKHPSSPYWKEEPKATKKKPTTRKTKKTSKTRKKTKRKTR